MHACACKSEKLVSTERLRERRPIGSRCTDIPRSLMSSVCKQVLRIAVTSSKPCQTLLTQCAVQRTVTSPKQPTCTMFSVYFAQTGFDSGRFEQPFTESKIHHDRRKRTCTSVSISVVFFRARVLAYSSRKYRRLSLLPGSKRTSTSGCVTLN